MAKKRLMVKPFLQDLKNGMDDQELMTKHGLSNKQFLSVIEKLVAKGVLPARELEAEGQVIPAMQEEVVLNRFEIPFWQAFSTLSSSRPIGMSAGPIPIAEVEAYLNIKYIFDLSEREDYMRFIKALDGAYMKHLADERKKNKKAKANAPKKARPARRRR